MYLNKVLTLSVNDRERRGVGGMPTVVEGLRRERGGTSEFIEIEQAFHGSNGELFRGAHTGCVNGREMQRRLQRPPQPAPAGRAHS